MDDPEQQAGFEAIDPTLRAHIYALVSALGGPSSDNSSIYVLGDDVLGCLRDIKRWLKGYDEKLNRLDVARCLSEANIVVGDILEILSHSGLKDGAANNNPNKVSLACVELLVPLTWPLEKTDYSMTVNHHRHMSTLKRSQVLYKQALLMHPSKSILKSCCVNALPPMEIPQFERSNRGDGIIRLILYLLRNLLRIENPEDENHDICQDVSRSATIEAFDIQGIFDFLTVVISGIPERFEAHDVVILEILFSLLKGIKMEDVGNCEASANPTPEETPLAQMLRHENGRKGGNSSSSRHNRFGTTIVLQKDNGQRAVVSGPGALISEEVGLRKLDSTKKWRKPQHTNKKERNALGIETQLSIPAKMILRKFLIQALKTGFNFEALFFSIRKAIERDSERVLTTVHPSQLFYTTAIFLDFARFLTRNEKLGTEDWAATFASLSAAFHAETLIVLFRHMRESLETKMYDDLQTSCLFFTQILLSATEMSHSQIADEREVADNILNRLFYEESIHDLMVAVLRSGSKRSLQYLNTVTELIHVYLRSLERYSKWNINMVLKSKRKSKSKHNTEMSDDDEGGTSRQSAQERKFEFIKCESKFLTQSCLEPFLEMLEHYSELGPSQVKRCIGFLHRIFVKRGETIQLFRLSTISLLHKLAKDTAGTPGYAETGVFIQHYSKQLTRKLADQPLLFVELLFQKSNKTSYFLQHGKEKEYPQTHKRRPASLEFRPGLDHDMKIKIAISLVLQDPEALEELDWMIAIIKRCSELRESWQTEAGDNPNDVDLTISSKRGVNAPTIAVQFEADSQAIKHFRNNKLQFLMRTIGFEVRGTTDSDFIYFLPGNIHSSFLTNCVRVIEVSKMSPIFNNEAGEGVSAYIITKRRRRSNDGSDHIQGHDLEMTETPLEFSSDEEFEFPDNLPGEKKIRKSKKTNSSRRKEKRDEKELQARREERRIKEKERRQGIKSTIYIASSDDDSDEERDREFFENESKLREAMSKATIENSSIEGELPTKKRPIGMTVERNMKRFKTANADMTSRQYQNDDIENDFDYLSHGDAASDTS